MLEKYKPSQEEIEKAENTMKELGLEERSKETQDAFEVGQERAKNDLLKLPKEELLEEKVKNNIKRLDKLAPQTYDRLKNTSTFRDLMSHGWFRVPEEYSRTNKFIELIDGLAQAEIEIEHISFNENDRDSDHCYPADYQAKIDKIVEKYLGAVIIIGPNDIEYEQNRHHTKNNPFINYLKAVGLNYR